MSEMTRNSLRETYAHVEELWALLESKILYYVRMVQSIEYVGLRLESRQGIKSCVVATADDPGNFKLFHCHNFTSGSIQAEIDSAKGTRADEIPSNAFKCNKARTLWCRRRVQFVGGTSLTVALRM